MKNQTGHIKSRESEGILHLQIHRPEKRNALTPEMYSALAEQLRAADSNDEIKVVLLFGEDRFFTSGNDLHGFRANPPADGRFPHSHFLEALSEVRKPVIAAVSGVALGIGTIMLLHCDLVFATAKTRFSFPFTKLGLSPEGGTSYLLPRLAGYQKAAELIFYGDQFAIDEAQSIGIVNEVVDAEHLLERAQQRARELAERSTGSVQAAKALLKKGLSASVQSAMARESSVFNERLNSPEAKSAIEGFFKGKG